MYEKQFNTKLKKDFDTMIKSNIVGQNWNCDLIYTFGLNGLETARSEETRCVCFSEDGKSAPVFRTSLDYPINKGMMVYIQEQEAFYLLEHDPQKDVNCYKTIATRCNAQISIYAKMPDVTDERGYLIRNGALLPVVENIPCVARPKQSLKQMDGGLVATDDLEITLEYNPYTANIRENDEFDLGDQMYTVYSYVIDGDHERKHGIMRLMCKRNIGGSLK